MKLFLFFLMSMAFGRSAFGQTDDAAVEWSFSVVKTGEGQYDVHMTAVLGSEWHTYSQETPAGGPAPTVVSFTPNPLVTLEGPVKEVGKLDKHFEPLFGVEVRQYSAKVDFVQHVVLKHPVKTSLSGKVTFMVCNDRECLPPEGKGFTVGVN